MKLVYDIETNGLDPDTIWCIVAHDILTGTTYKFADSGNYHGMVSDGVSFLSRADLLIGHNIIGFDSRVVDNLFGTNLIDKPSHDTYVMSQVLRYKRKHTHGLKAWGEQLGNYKISYDDWSCFSPEMMKYCVQDVMLNVAIYNKLLEELAKISSKYPLIKKGLQIEHDTAKFNAKMRMTGWNFDLDKARETQGRMLERMNEIERIIEPQMGERKIWIDKEERIPKFKKNGEYTSATAKQLTEYHGKPVSVADTDVHPAGTPFRRYRMEPIAMGSIDLVKDWLLSIGWKPDEYQKKKIGFEWVTMGPKLTTTSLSQLGETGELVDEYYTLRSRQAVLTGWIEGLQDGRLHGNMAICGTPTFRCRHSTIVNLPAITAKWGTELRELLKADEGTVLVGCDSAGNQLRGLCHYVRNDDFTNEVINGDQHQRNADTLNCSRPVAKSYLYAYLFGAGDGKLGQVLTGKNNPTVGKNSKIQFAKSIKGLMELRGKLADVWKRTKFNQGDGWFPALDGRPIFCNSEHQTLNYLLQSAEAITCKAAVSYQMEKIKEAGIVAEPRIFYHDEVAWQCKPEDAGRVGEILRASFSEAPSWFGVDCMDGGDAVVGDNYAEVH